MNRLHRILFVSAFTLLLFGLSFGLFTGENLTANETVRGPASVAPVEQAQTATPTPSTPVSSPTSATEQDCHKRRGALDIGSGSTKALVAIVDVCVSPRRIVEVLFQDQLPVQFSEALGKSSNGMIPAPFAKEATSKIRTILNRMREFNPSTISGVATAVFRKAENGEAVVQELSDALGIPVRVISQAEEAEIGALSALAALPVSNSTAPVIVWDIGGGSMQMWNKHDGKVELFTGDLASVSFKNKVIQEVLKKDPAEVSSPNPLGAKYHQAVPVSFKHAKQNVPDYFKKSGKNARWIGIGGVLALSVQKQVRPEERSFSQSMLRETLKRRSALNDGDIASDYRATEITNLALVLGYMQALRIPKMETVEANLSQGVVLRD
ncbi:MAG: hypothetical protein RBT63_09050 [Bdellovibrionales bacterium]|jgi:exopolyphosphatase/guanosine-5'-triphosphate,3'-diphosphate pyrophosphatase|nr:hypothetical protein [Bdellovibrionales bacterium]